VFWVLPIQMILRNQETSKKEKLLWILAALLISWLSFILFVFLAPIFPNDDDKFHPA
jgi:predicted permease